MKSDVSQILDILQEEAAECIQAVSKIRRFGWDNSHGDNPTNRIHLCEEIGDLEAMIQLLKDSGEISTVGVAHFKEAKLDKLRKWSTIESVKIH
jgi:NTP pyrophosphatase (non-canonical NTP hydrolase)